MALEHLRQIREKEEQAEKIKQDGINESMRIIKAAQDEAAALIEKAHADAKKRYAEVIAKANEEAEEDYKKIIHGAMWECDMLSESASKNHEEAVSLIVKKVMGKWRS